MKIISATFQMTFCRDTNVPSTHAFILFLRWNQGIHQERGFSWLNIIIQFSQLVVICMQNETSPTYIFTDCLKLDRSRVCCLPLQL